MRRADSNVPPPWVTAPGMASSALPAESVPDQAREGRSSSRAPSVPRATDSWETDSWTPDARAPDSRNRTVHASAAARKSGARVSGRWPRRPAGPRARRTDHRFPPGRFLGVVAAAACAAVVGGALAWPTSGPSPPSAAPVATTERSTAGENPTDGGADVERGADAGAGSSADPATPSTDSAPTGSAPADSRPADSATADSRTCRLPTCRSRTCRTRTCRLGDRRRDDGRFDLARAGRAGSRVRIDVVRPRRRVEHEAIRIADGRCGGARP